MPEMWLCYYSLRDKEEKGMVVYTAYTLHGARCAVCKRWIKEVISKKPEFPEIIECSCTTKYTPKQMVDDLNAKMDVKIFDSEKLYKRIVQEYLAKNSSLQKANDMAQIVVSREKDRFERKYGFDASEQKTLL